MPFRFNPFTDRLDLTDTENGPGSGIRELQGDSGSTTSTISKITAGPAAGQTSGATVHIGQGFPDSLVLYLGDSNYNTTLGVYAGPLGGFTDPAAIGNTGLGYSVLSSLTGAGTYNLGLGYGALDRLLSGKFNVGLGLYQTISGIFPVGYDYTSNESSNILIHNAGITGENNTMRLGTDGTSTGQTSRTFIAGIKGVSVSNPQPVMIDPATGQLGQGSAAGDPIGALEYFANVNGDSYVTSLGWLKCDGSILSQASYTTLFARMGLINAGGTVWANRTSITSSTLQAVAAGPSNYVSGGLTGGGPPSMATSTDSITWTKVWAPTTQPLRALIYAGGQYVGTCDGGIVLTSTDGVSFSTRTPTQVAGIGNNGNMLIWDGSKHISGGSVGLINTSTDGILWTGRNSQTTSSIYALVYGNSLHVYAGASGQLATSTDAITWTQRTSGTTSQIQSLVYGTKYVYGAAGGLIATSTDAITWVAQVSGTASPVWSLAYGNNLYVMGCTGGFLQTSTDAVTWTSRTSQTTSTINTITYGTVYVYGAGGGRIASSTDAITWTNRTSGTTSTILALIYANNLYVYAGIGGTQGTSTDGTTWTSRTGATTSALSGLDYDGTLWHAIGANFSLTSTDAITWTTVTQSGTAGGLFGLAYNGSIYVAGGTSGTLLTSTDAMTWTSRTSNTASQINAITFGTVFAYGTQAGGIGSSTDGITWTARTSNTTSSIFALTYGGAYIAVGASGAALTSTDATTWTTLAGLTTTQTLSALTYGNSLYVTSGTNGVIFTSSNGSTWTSQTSPTTQQINGLTAGSYFVGVGGAGAIISSNGTYPYNAATQFQLPQDAGLGITVELTTNFFRSLYIKAT